MAETDEYHDISRVTNANANANGVRSDQRLLEGLRRRGQGSPMAVTDQERDLAVKQIRHAAQQMHSDFVDQMTDRLNNLLDGFVGQVARLGDLESPMEESPKGKRPPLAEKVFVPRESLLTNLLKDKNIQTIYNIFVAMLIVIIMNTFITDMLDTGSIRMDFGMLQWAFGEAPIVLWTWFLMQMWAMLVFYGTFQYWSYQADRRYTPLNIAIPDAAWLGIYVVYQVVFLLMPMRVILVHELPIASSIIVTTEQIRVLMKMHAFMRENIPRALAWKKAQRAKSERGSHSKSPRKRKSSGDADADVDDLMVARSESHDGECQDPVDLPCPDFSKFLYFLFCPTFIYRDNYPRTSRIRWNVVRYNFLQVLGCLFYTFYLFDCFCLPLFKNFGEEILTVKSLARATFTCMLPATLMLLLAFFAILHSWLNAFAEMLRFADRQFYKDWWTCKSYSAYYRMWNAVVHDWLYTYIYRDCQLLGLGRFSSSIMVFVISAIFHEYIIVMALQFFYPVLLFFFFGVGVPLFLTMAGERTSAFWNIFMWITLICGMGLIMVFYTLEWNARIYCDYDRDTWMQLVVPQTWGCQLS